MLSRISSRHVSHRHCRSRPRSQQGSAIARLRDVTQYTVMETCNKLAALAVRTCGGQSILRPLPLERMDRDSRCGSLMLPWTAEICIERLGRECLYESGERDE